MCMCIYICMHIHVYVYIYICTCVCIYMYLYIYIYICMHIYGYVYIYTRVCIYMYLYIYIHMYAYTWICIYTCCMHIHVYIYIHTYVCIYSICICLYVWYTHIYICTCGFFWTCFSRHLIRLVLLYAFAHPCRGSIILARIYSCMLPNNKCSQKIIGLHMEMVKKTAGPSCPSDVFRATCGPMALIGTWRLQDLQSQMTCWKVLLSHIAGFAAINATLGQKSGRAALMGWTASPTTTATAGRGDPQIQRLCSCGKTVISQWGQHESDWCSNHPLTELCSGSFVGATSNDVSVTINDGKSWWKPLLRPAIH